MDHKIKWGTQVIGEEPDGTCFSKREYLGAHGLLLLITSNAKVDTERDRSSSCRLVSIDFQAPSSNGVLKKCVVTACVYSTYPNSKVCEGVEFPLAED